VWTIKQTYLIAPIFRMDSIENLYVSLFATYSIIFLDLLLYHNIILFSIHFTHTKYDLIYIEAMYKIN